MTTLDKILVFNSLISLGAHMYMGTKWAQRRTNKEIRIIRNRIIKYHVKAGHEGRLKHCLDDACASLRKPVRPQDLRPVVPEAVRTES